MDLAIHSGFGQTEPHLTVTEDPPIYGDCKVTRYRFTDSDGAVLIITHFEHARRPDLLPRAPQVDSDNPEPQPLEPVEMF